MQRCPCCNARLAGATVCPRCQTDLRQVMASALAAQAWLQQALQDWAAHKHNQSIRALVFSLQLKQSPLGLAFRDFVISQQTQEILSLLAQQQVLSAKRQLYGSRLLLPHSPMLQQLDGFTDYLLAN